MTNCYRETQQQSAECHPQAETLLRIKLESGTRVIRMKNVPSTLLSLSVFIVFSVTHKHTHTQGTQHTIQLFTTDTYLRGASKMPFV